MLDSASGQHIRVRASFRLIPWVAWWGLFVVAILPVVWCQITTSDCWWHLHYGRCLAQNFQQPDFHSFYFTPTKVAVPDFRWTFLGDLILSGAYALGGVPGLQLLVHLCILSSCAILVTVAPERRSATTLLLLISFVVGTYQLQLHRNAVFSLVLVTTLLWVFHRSRILMQTRFLWLAPLLIGLWSTLHGSYILGVALLALLLLGDLTDSILRHSFQRRVHVYQSALILGISIALMQIGSPNPNSLLTTPFRRLLSSQTQHPAKSPAAPINEADHHSGIADRTKDFLNNLIWPVRSAQPRSADFDSPFKRLGYRPVVISFFLGVLALVDLLFFIPRARISLLLTQTAVFVAGMCYFRLTGYIAIIAAFSLLVNSKERVAPQWAGFLVKLWPKATIGIIALWVITSYVAVAMGLFGNLIGKQQHVIGFGKIPTFDTKMCDYVLRTYPTEKVFTTIATGSFALFQWQQNKSVFVDGFFSPHHEQVWADYLEIQRTGDVNLLHTRYGVQLALIEHERTDWIGLFMRSQMWMPVAIGSGQIVFAFIPDAQPYKLQLLTDAAEIASLPHFFKHALAISYFQTMAKLRANAITPPEDESVNFDKQVTRELQSCLNANELCFSRGVMEGM